MATIVRYSESRLCVGPKGKSDMPIMRYGYPCGAVTSRQRTMTS